MRSRGLPRTRQSGLQSAQPDDLLLLLLDGVFETPPWTGFLNELRRRTSADYASLIFRPPGLASNTVFHLFSGKRSPVVVQQLYRASFYKDDPTPYHQMAEGQVYTLDELLNRDDPRHKAYREQVVVPSGMNQLRMLRVQEASGVSAWLTITRRQTDFSREQADLLSVVGPYLRSVLRSFVASERDRVNAVLATDAIHRLSCGWITLEKTGRILGADALGQHVLKHSGVLRRDRRGYLRAILPDGEFDLSQILTELTTSPAPQARAVVLSRDPWFDMLLVPANASSTSATSVPAAVAYVQRESSFATDRCEQLRQLFNLLPSESRLALALSRGMSLAEAAQDLGLTLQTVRTYSKKLYAKMGARGQADLVRFVHRSVLRIV
ncbi:MAG TPA: sigma factor-like helix-turn-helix DNA-binding protein [Steroidobacteraceae bacterium]|nr:sigma factor-like helix-turn-helix DNA-binding protein [Steroidobacteraceae bacterium]